MTQQAAGNLIWIDLEMSGLDPQHDSILEIATVVTDAMLNVVAEGPVLAIDQPDGVLDNMDDWNKEHHGRSGLIERVRHSVTSEREAERRTLRFLAEHVPARTSPMCGNSICQDRRFLARCMPELEGYFHYRNLDVSSLKELAQRWAPSVLAGFEKTGAHVALDDVYDSIRELRYYRDHFLRLP